MPRSASPPSVPGPMTSGMASGWADLSRCGRYRYGLGRRWDAGAEALFVMLNPSTADASVDDPTLRRCMAFARREGCGASRSVNLFAWRATAPRDLMQAGQAGQDIVGRRNGRVIAEALAACDGPVIVGWGAHDLAVPRAAALADLAARQGRGLWCLGVTKSGQPRHPLYIRKEAALVPWPCVQTQE